MQVIITVDSAFCHEATFLLAERLQSSYIRKITFCFSICSVYPEGKVSILIFSYLIPHFGPFGSFLDGYVSKVFYSLQFKVLKPTNFAFFHFCEEFSVPGL